MSYPFQKEFTLAGRVYKLFDKVQVSPHFVKRDLILGVAKNPSLGPEMGHKPTKIEFSQENVALLDRLKVGDDVTVTFTIEGREYPRNGEMQYFVLLNGVKVEKEGDEPDYDPEGYAPNTIRLGSRTAAPFPSDPVDETAPGKELPVIRQPFPRLEPDPDEVPPGFS